MIALICLLVVLAVGNCSEQFPTRQEIETSINRTIEEVEKLVKDDPSLPKLSRKEIVDILFDITSTDMKSYEKSVEKTRKDYQRALMIVLPYSPNDTRSNSIQELYTKAPVIKIVKDNPVKPSNKTNHWDNRADLKIESNYYNNHRETYTEISTESPTQETLRSIVDKGKTKDSAPEKFSFNLEDLETVADTETSERPSFNSFLPNESSHMKKSNLEIIYSTIVTQKPTTKLPTRPHKVDNGFRPTMPRTKSTQNVLTSDQWRYNAPPSSTTSRPSESSVNLKNHHGSTTVPFPPIMMTATVEKNKVSVPTLNPDTLTSTVVMQSQEHVDPRWEMEELRIVKNNEERAPFYVTPMSATTSTKADASSTTKNETIESSMHMREEVQDLLASIGLRPGSDGSNNKVINNVKNDHDKIFGTHFQIPNSSNAILAQTSGLTAIGNDLPTIISQNTFQTIPQDVKKGVNNLSPDVQLLFQRFGLQSSIKDQETATTKETTEKPRVFTTKTSFWNNFKPIPTSQVRDEVMRDFLAKFGLGMEDDRKEKSMESRLHSERKKPSLIEAVPGNMKGILENIGLITRTQRPPVSLEIVTTNAPHLHVFKPHETSIDDDKQRAKINKLLDTVKMVQDGKANVSAVQIAAKELLETTKKLKNGPDPLSIEEILRIYNNDIKNEIKRQQDPKDLQNTTSSDITNSTLTMTSSEVEISTTDKSANLTDSSGSSSDFSATSTESSSDSKDLGSLVDFSITENSNLESLADSFGGSTAAPDPVLPTPRKTGLYFLVDWNTFLEVGEEGKDKVNLRFQPKAGDRTRFLPVTVP